MVQGSTSTAARWHHAFSLTVSERLPKVKLPADNPLTVEGVDLGRRLFHDARLSKNNSQSCATCHEQAKAFTDGRHQSPGESGQPGRRNSMPLVNLAWGKEFFWDGRAKSLREQVLLPIQDAHEMNETLERVVAKLTAEADYPAQFQAAFGTAGITSDRMARALEQFLLTLVSQESKFDRAARKLDHVDAARAARLAVVRDRARSSARVARRGLFSLPRRQSFQQSPVPK